jgi:uncharacterized protein (TIGR00251 family)
MGQPGCATGIARLRVIFTGEDTASATYDPCVFKPGDITFRGAEMPDITDAVFEDADGILIAIEVSASAKANEFPAGYNEWRNAVGCRVTAPASEGKANKAVISFIAKKLEVPASTVTIVSGMTSAQKKIHIAGIAKLRVTEFLILKQNTR